MNFSAPEAYNRLAQIDAGILTLLEERIELQIKLKEWRLAHEMPLKNEDVSTKKLLKKIQKSTPELSISEEKLLLLWGKIVEITGSDHSE